MMKADSLKKADTIYRVTRKTSESKEEKPKTSLRELQTITAMVEIFNAVTSGGWRFIGGGLF